MEFSEQLKSAVDIVEVIGSYLRLKRVGAGPRYTGLCPFHSEHTPSFSVHSGRQFYYCFGCQEKGDVFTFIMKMDGLTFYEALKSLAERYGMPMPKRTEGPDPEARVRAALYSMQEIAMQVFRTNLQGGQGTEVQGYLRKRGVSPTAASEFSLGLADRGGQSLVRKLQQEGFSADQIESSGLAGRREDGSLYDRFRGRLMFPIHNESGQLVGFGGRALSADDPVKYINSPETAIYKKSTLLYNLNRAKESIRRTDQIILVEGYMDVIGVHDAGVKSVVASCGTSLTDLQVKTMKRHSQRVVVNFDPDSAGANATERYVDKLLEEGMRIKILQLQDGLDPDEFVRQMGVDAYRAALKQAPPLFDWLGDRARTKFGTRTAEERLEGFRYLVPTIKKIPDKLQRITIAKDLAAHLGVEERIVREHFREEVQPRRGPANRTVPRQAPQGPRLQEVMLVFALLKSEQARREFLPQAEFLDGVENRTMKQVLDTLFDLHREGRGVSFALLQSRLEEDAQRLISSLALTEEEPSEEIALARARDCWRKLELESRKRRVDALRFEVKEAERSGDLSYALRLMAELRELERA